MSDRFIDRANTHTKEQSRVMDKIAQDAVCPFCAENLSEYHKTPILKKGSFWILTTNQWPYENIDFHFLIIYRQHIEAFSEIDPKAGKELLEFCQWAEKKYDLKGGALTMRFGDTNFSGATVNHLHAQLIVPVEQQERTATVLFHLGKGRNQAST